MIDEHPTEPDIEGHRLPPVTISYANAARITGLSSKTLQRMVKAGRIKAKRFGNKVLLDHGDIMKLITDLPLAFPELEQTEAEAA